MLNLWRGTYQLLPFQGLTANTITPSIFRLAHHHVLLDLHSQQEPGLSRKLQEWQKAWEDKLKDYNNLDDDKLIHTSLRTSFF